MTSNSKKYLIGLSIVCLILSMYIISSVKEITIKQVDSVENLASNSVVTQEIVQIDMEEYQEEMKIIFLDFEAMLNHETSSTTDNADENVDTIVEKINNLKEKIISIKAPSKDFGSLHISLTLSMDKFSSYLLNNNEKDLNETLNLVSEIEKEFDWLKS